MKFFRLKRGGEKQIFVVSCCNFKLLEKMGYLGNPISLNLWKEDE